MAKHQLFRVIPDIEIVTSLLELFGLNSLQDTNFFTKQTIEENNTINTLNDMKDILEKYYIPCKSKIYLINIDTKRTITILRQFIRVHGYTLISKERYIDGNKMSVYRLIEHDNKSIPKKKKVDKPITISFQ